MSGYLAPLHEKCWPFNGTVSSFSLSLSMHSEYIMAAIQAHYARVLLFMPWLCSTLGRVFVVDEDSNECPLLRRSSGLIGRIQLARPRVYVISGSLVSLCGALFINTRLVTFTLNPTILPLPWAEDLVTTLGGLGMLLALLVPKFCIPEHLSHPPTEASVQYLASAIDELCAGALPLGPQSRGQGAAQVQCRQLHVFAQVRFAQGVVVLTCMRAKHFTCIGLNFRALGLANLAHVPASEPRRACPGNTVPYQAQYPQAPSGTDADNRQAVMSVALRSTHKGSPGRRHTKGSQ